MRKTQLEQWICDMEGLPTLSREELDALQLRRLNEMVGRMRQRGGIYVNLPERLNTLAELQTLPFTTPEMLSRQPGQFLVTSQSEVSRIISEATSGTTGNAKRVFYTAGDTEKTVGFFAAGISEMLSPGETCMIAFPFSGAFGLGDLIAKAVERLGAVPIKAGFGQSYLELCKLVEKRKPKTYIGFPVPLLSLARMYGRHFPIQKALVSGDACPPGVMRTLETLLGSRLYPHYGSRESVLGGAVTCQAFEGMHLRENHIIAEIVDEQGRPVPDGEYGELVITTIGMEAMPLLRYRTGDMTRILPELCPCGGVTRRLDRVSRKSAGVISMENLDSVLFPISGLVDYQAEWDGVLRLDAKVLNQDVGEQMQRQIHLGYPQLEIIVTTESARLTDCPYYLGKRHII